MPTLKRIGFVATGDELVNGDILNTNCQRFCQRFLEQSLLPGQQVVVGDDESDIAAAIEFLRPKHSAIITIGGLGPTSDDVTRNSLARALQLPLVYAAEAWDWIVDKLQSLGYAEVPETNRQQAYFPEGATLLRNLNGTAAGCHLSLGDQDFFMLPGPPNECLPLFEQHVLPTLLQRGYASPVQRQSWLLLGVSEGDMAGKLQPLAREYPDVTLGFRVSYPYLEVKLVSANPAALDLLSQRITPSLAPHVVSTSQHTATQQLRAWLCDHAVTLQIEDSATHGALLQQLLSPKTASRLLTPASTTQIRLSGLQHYWQATPGIINDELTVELETPTFAQRAVIPVPLRGERTLVSACERTAWWVLNHLRK